MKQNEEARFSAYMKKLKGICEENDIQATFSRSDYPLTMTVRPLQDMTQQMTMLENAEDAGYTSPDASIVFVYKDGEITYQTSEKFTIGDNLFTKLKNLFRNLHDVWLQYFHRQIMEKHLLAQGQMPNLPDDADGFGDLPDDDLDAPELIDTTPPDDDDEV